MTTTQTLPNHSSFASKLLTDQSIHNFASTKPSAENEAFAKSVSHRTTRNSSATKTLLKAHEQNDSLTRQEVALQSRESIRKPEKNVHTTSSENSMSAQSDILSNKAAGKSGQSLEKTLGEKTMQGYEVARSGKTNEDDTGYNTRIHVKPSEYVSKSDDGKDLSGSKKSTSETGTNRQSRGYHLRSTGGKSSQRGTEFLDEDEDQHLARNLSSTDLSEGYQRSRDHQGSPSSNNGNMGGSNEEISTSYGGFSKKSGSAKSNKHPSLNSILCTEEISCFDIPTDRDGNRGQLPEAELNCTEQLEDFKEHMQVEAKSESNDSGTRSGSMAKVDRQRKKETKCYNKLCLTDHKIPSLWSKEKINGSAICKLCLDAHKKEQFCQFCAQIYFDDDTLAAADDKDWIECDSCGCWNHIECEAAQGLKNIFNLLQKDRNYKYFCPPCRQGKNQKRTKQQATAQGALSPESPSANMIIEKPKASKQQQPKNEHPRPPLDDWLACEEGLEEPSIVKIKVNDNREATVEVSQKKEEEKVEEEDPLKRKLDSLFNKASNKRRTQVKPVVPVFESFGEVDKLMTQYGGKKLQLSEQEIKSDLSQIRELLKIGENIETNDAPIKMTEVQEPKIQMEMVVEETSEVESVEDKPTPRNKNSRAKQQQRRGEKAQERDRSSRAIKEERIVSTSRKEKEREREREKDFIKDFEPTSHSEVGTTAARRQLRMRKVN